MNVRSIFFLVLIVSALVLFAGCTGQQPVAQPSPVPTTQVVATTPAPTISEKPVTTTVTVVQADDTRQLLVNKAWKVLSYRTEPKLDLNNTSVQAYLADYKLRANDTFTWYDNGTLVYRNSNGTVYTTGTWNLTKNNTALIEKYTSPGGFYLAGENTIVNLSKSTFVIGYPVVIAGKEYFFIETHGL